MVLELGRTTIPCVDGWVGHVWREVGALTEEILILTSNLRGLLQLKGQHGQEKGVLDTCMIKTYPQAMINFLNCLILHPMHLYC